MTEKPMEPAEPVCLTCSDLAVPMRVVELLGDGMAIARADAGGPQEISVALVEAGPGDVVLVHAGEAIAVGGECG
ncbi:MULTISPECIES: HypC/HybG/HupF family hydrogenase formation chaperone [unclassified Nonomuraea]|uniref:HypC/HybG/HupF family hydrogenase formation chaperone n=1 Tax=unclassified Nonomuraea TaxID=2593643 RepID=UPI0033EE5A42